MKPPPLSASPAAASPWVADLWEKAFGTEGAKPGGRPKAEDWVQALTRLEQHFKRCSSRPSHFYFDGLSECPWCPIERAGIALFGGAAVVIPKLASGPFNLDAIWRDITTAVLPPMHALPQVKAVPANPQIQALGRRHTFWKTTGWLVGLLIVVLGIALSAVLAPCGRVWAGRWARGSTAVAVRTLHHWRQAISKRKPNTTGSSLDGSKSKRTLSFKRSRINFVRCWMSMPVCIRNEKSVIERCPTIANRSHANSSWISSRLSEPLFRASGRRRKSCWNRLASRRQQM